MANDRNSYLIGSQPNYGEQVGELQNGQVIFTDDFNKFLDDLLRTLSANFTTISEILESLGADPEEVSEIVSKGLTISALKQFVMVESDDDPPAIPSNMQTTAEYTLRAKRSDGTYEDYVVTPDA